MTTPYDKPASYWANRMAEKKCIEDHKLRRCFVCSTLRPKIKFDDADNERICVYCCNAMENDRLVSQSMWFEQFNRHGADIQCPRHYAYVWRGFEGKAMFYGLTYDAFYREYEIPDALGMVEHTCQFGGESHIDNPKYDTHGGFNIYSAPEVEYGYEYLYDIRIKPGPVSESQDGFYVPEKYSEYGHLCDYISDRYHFEWEYEEGDEEARLPYSHLDTDYKDLAQEGAYKIIIPRSLREEVIRLPDGRVIEPNRSQRTAICKKHLSWLRLDMGTNYSATYKKVFTRAMTARYYASQCNVFHFEIIPIPEQFLVDKKSQARLIHHAMNHPYEANRIDLERIPDRAHRDALLRGEAQWLTSESYGPAMMWLGEQFDTEVEYYMEHYGDWPQLQAKRLMSPWSNVVPYEDCLERINAVGPDIYASLNEHYYQEEAAELRDMKKYGLR